MQVIQREFADVCFLHQKQHDLSEIVSDETIIIIPAQAPEREADEFLQQREIVIPVLVVLVEGIKLIRTVLQFDHQVVDE